MLRFFFRHYFREYFVDEMRLLLVLNSICGTECHSIVNAFRMIQFISVLSLCYLHPKECCHIMKTVWFLIKWKAKEEEEHVGTFTLEYVGYFAWDTHSFFLVSFWFYACYYVLHGKYLWNSFY